MNKRSKTSKKLSKQIFKNIKENLVTHDFRLTKTPDPRSDGSGIEDKILENHVHLSDINSNVQTHQDIKSKNTVSQYRSRNKKSLSPSRNKKSLSPSRRK